MFDSYNNDWFEAGSVIPMLSAKDQLKADIAAALRQYNKGLAMLSKANKVKGANKAYFVKAAFQHLNYWSKISRQLHKELAKMEGK